MFILGNPIWSTTGAGTAPPPPPPTVDVSVRPSGGFPAYDRGPTEEQRHRSRVLHGLEAEIVAKVAARQAAALDLDGTQQQQELAGELALRRIELRSEHLQALADQRQALIDRELGERLRLMQDNQDAVLLILIAAS